MLVPACPRCRIPLRTGFFRDRADAGTAGWTGRFHRCDRCAGALVGIGVLRQHVAAEPMRRLWAFVDGPTPRTCPLCSLPMRAARPTDAVEIDVCRTCHVVWFDREELGHLPRRPPTPRAPAIPADRVGGVRGGSRGDSGWSAWLLVEALSDLAEIVAWLW
jgi:hypothetical protein